MNASADKPKFFQRGLAILIGFVLVKLLIHLYTNAFASYGIFRDELYYIACSNRLDFGYVDQPPLSLFILAISRLVFGDSLFALRLLPAIAGALTVFITGLMVRKMGGGKLAIAIACLALIAAPIHLGMNTFYSMNCFDILFWTLGAYILLLLIKEQNSKLWIALGLVIGVGLLNKIGMLWFGFGLVVAMLLTSQRKYFSTKWPYLAAFIAFFIFLPFIIWNFVHDFAHLEFIRNATARKYSSLTPIDFILGQIIIQNPATLPIWLAGLYYFFFDRDGKTYRSLGIIYIAVFLILIINIHSKAEYLAPAYPMLFAAGGIMMAKLSQKRYWIWIKYAVPTVIIVGGIFLAPLALPILPVETYIKYTKSIGFKPTTAEAKELSELPQFYADMFGWENMAKTISKVYDSIPQQEKSKTVVYAQNYGEAGAIEYYGREYDLPPVISTHNNYWLWGYGSDDWQTFIVIGGDKDDHLNACEQVEQAAIIRCDYCMPYENNLPVYICRKLKRKLSENWNSMKNYN